MIRLQRVGRRNDPSFRIVVQEKQKSAKSGKVIEVVGSYDPILHKRELKAERLKHWLRVGAALSDTVHNMLVSAGIVPGPKHDVAARRKVSEEAKQETLTEEKIKPEEQEAEKSEEPAQEPAAAEKVPQQEGSSQ